MPCQTFEVIQDFAPNASLYKARMHKDRAYFAVCKVKHSCRHRLSLDTAQIDVLLHQCVISILGRTGRLGQQLHFGGEVIPSMART